MLLVLYDTLYPSGTGRGESQEWLNQVSGGGTIPSGLNLSWMCPVVTSVRGSVASFATTAFGLHKFLYLQHHIKFIFYCSSAATSFTDFKLCELAVVVVM